MDSLALDSSPGRTLANPGLVGPRLDRRTRLLKRLLVVTAALIALTAGVSSGQFVTTNDLRRADEELQERVVRVLIAIAGIVGVLGIRSYARRRRRKLLALKVRPNADREEPATATAALPVENRERHAARLKARARAVLASSIAIFLLGACVGWSGCRSEITSLLGLSVILLALSGHFQSIGFRLQKQADALLKPTVQDDRPPVLLLRPFAEEGLPADRTGVFDVIQDVTSVEEVILESFSNVGPVIALRNPIMSDPAISYSTLQTGEDWKLQVATQIARARAVVLLLAESSGVLWEVNELARQQALSKSIIFLAPAAADDRKRRWDRFVTVLEEVTPQASMALRSVAESIQKALLADDGDAAMAVAFDARMQPRLFAGSRGAFGYQKVTESFIESLPSTAP